MRFGLISGSYDTNFSGGVLRSKPVDLYGQEINQRTGQIRSTSKVIKTIDMFRVVGYSYPTTYGGGGSYNAGGNEGTCSPTGGIPVEGTCRSWGEPFAEMFYEAIRYFRGLAATDGATAQFYSGTPDNNITSFAMGLSRWHVRITTFPIVANNGYGDPYTGAPLLCEYCAKPFVLMFGDAFPSHDSDQLPGAQAWTTAPSQVNPTTNDTGISMATLLSNSQMDTLDPITSAFIGEVNGGTANSICSAKATTTFLNIRGLCPEEPNKYGSYYLPMLAHYAKTMDLVEPWETIRPIRQTEHHDLCRCASAPVPILSSRWAATSATLVGLHSGCPAAWRTR
jgi:type IV pilus assembly protein PilY1